MIQKKNITDQKSIRDDDVSIISARYDFGYSLMGPVVAEYLMKLHGTALFFEEVRGAKVLFVSRAGIRIRRALETYLKTTSAKSLKNPDDFWISRLMVAKGIWKHNKSASIATLSAEFFNLSIRDLVHAMFRQDGVPESFPLKHKSLDATGSKLVAFFELNGPAAKALSSYFDQQSEMFDTYVKSSLGDKDRALLIDTGWAGTAQRLLADAFPDIEWWGAYFGRYGFEHTDRKYWHNMIGIVFEQDKYEFSKPETCMILHRHLIEDLFEPAGDSIERLVETANGTILAPESKAVLKENPDKNSDPIFTGVLDYLSKLPDGQTPIELHKNARKAWREISRIVTLPSADDVKLFSDISRSADFGKALKVSLLLAPKERHDGDTPEKRIKAALWQSGQAAIEFPKEIADPLQRKLAGLARFDFKQPEKKSVVKIKQSKRPTVAIITRTLDRPMFLKRAIASVAGQTFTDYVQVVVNDGGDIELARQTIEEADCAHHKIILVDNVVNRGMEAASNIAISAVDSDYIIIHDDDDSWEPEFLAKTVAFLAGTKRRTYGGVITQSTYVSEEVTAKGLKIHGTDIYQGWVENVHIMEMAIGNFFPPIAFLFRREIYDKIKGYNEEYPVLGDWDFNLRFLMESDIGMIHEALANYHHRDKGDTSLFGNSVIAGRDKHLEYAAVVRNNFARNMLHTDHPAMAVLVGLGLHLDANRSAIRDIQLRTNNISERISGVVTLRADPTSTQHGDDYWVAMSRYRQAIARNDKKVLREIGVDAVSSLGAIMGRKARSNGKVDLSWQAIQYLTSLNKTGYKLETPPDFDEERYININTDVGKAIEEGQLTCGFEHYYRYGRHEGRQRPTRSMG